jgi:nucleotide-binding universal stress UspA family protein
MASRPGESQSPSGAEKRPRPFTILVPLDGSERAASALPVAADLCARLKGEIALTHVLPLTLTPFEINPGYIPPHVYQQLADDQERLARADLEQAAAALRQRGLPVRIYIQRGDPASAIVDAASAASVRLVVMTSHGRTGLSRFALGSVADRVVRVGVAPVLLLRSYPEAGPRMELRSAFVPLDGSPLAEPALFDVALELAGAVLREITLARAVDQRDGPEGVAVAAQYLAQTRERFIAQLDGRDCAVSTLTRVGPPAACLLAAADERQADLILMSTHGEAGVGRLAFGSVTDRLLRDGRLPLLLVHPPKAAFGQ